MLYKNKTICYTEPMETKLDIVNFKNDNLYFLYVERRVQRGITGREHHNHSFYEIMYVADGESEYAIENKRYLLKGGDALLVKPYRHHLEYNRIAEKSSLYCIGFSVDAIANGALAEQIFKKCDFVSPGNDSAFAKILSAIKTKLRDSRENAEGYVRSLIEALVFALSDCSSRSEGKSEIKNGVVEKTLDYIKANLVNIQSLESIADALFFSKAYVRGVFAKEMGIGIMQYVRNKKVALAHEKILRGEKPTEIYTECGFNTYSSFYRAYLAYFGYPPKTKKR